PSDTFDVPLGEDVRVMDPRHPLFGRRLRVLGLIFRTESNLPPSYEVENDFGTRLFVPIRATESPIGMENPSKLCVESLRDLISLAEQLEDHADRSERSLVETSRLPAATGRRGHSGRSYGGRP
ncbi:hypothetical protein VQ042_25190, partial [Aurantimonas sp. A2-1-M11]|uniref:hypothetical protein n=1 Tax=Aurantimonas sp. A2-1-M11 TaxID=3113712 RepID=UPI002F95EC71